MVTIKKIAREAGVSLATVSRVLTNSRPVRPELHERVMNVAHELGYVPNTAARALVKRRTDSIGVVVNNLHDPFFHDLIRGFEAGAAQTDYNVVFCSAMSRARQLKQRYVRYLSNGVVDGIILYASYDSDEAVVHTMPCGISTGSGTSVSLTLLDRLTNISVLNVWADISRQ